VRVEQLYPWPEADLQRIVERYAHVESVFWVQEEPANMGGWIFVRDRVQGLLPGHAKLSYAGRRASASTATGSPRIHRLEQAALVQAAFLGLD
jgi:2-oxoglutarate dehydrogenase E1 component